MALQTLRNPSRLALIALLAFALAACTSASESGREGGGGESGSEHGQGAEGSEGGGGEGSGEHGGGGEGSEGGGGDGEESAVQLSPTQTFWMTRKGVRLDLRYDAATQSFRGSATNITGAPIPRVRVEVHLSNGVELGPTTTMDLAPGQTVDVTLPAPGQTFAQWGAHAESDGPAQVAAFTPSLGAWAVVDGVPLGIEHPTHRLSAWYTSSGGAWTPHLSPDPAPQHQPTGCRDMDGRMGRRLRVRFDRQHGRGERDGDAGRHHGGGPHPPGRSDPRHAAVERHAGHRRAVHGQHRGQLQLLRRRGPVRRREPGRRRGTRHGPGFPVGVLWKQELTRSGARPRDFTPGAGNRVETGARPRRGRRASA